MTKLKKAKYLRKGHRFNLHRSNRMNTVLLLEKGTFGDSNPVVILNGHFLPPCFGRHHSICIVIAGIPSVSVYSRGCDYGVSLGTTIIFEATSFWNCITAHPSASACRGLVACLPDRCGSRCVTFLGPCNECSTCVFVGRTFGGIVIFRSSTLNLPSFAFSCLSKAATKRTAVCVHDTTESIKASEVHATKYNDTAARYTPGDGMIGVQFIGYLLWYRFGLCGFTRALLLLAACRG